jgi:hypothetical protein
MPSGSGEEDSLKVRSGNSLECCYLTEDTFKEVITKVAFFSTFVFEKYLWTS